MEFFTNHILSLTIFSPLVVALFILFLPQAKKRLLFTVGTVLSVIPFVFSLVLYQRFQNTGTFEFMELLPWVDSFNIQYLLGIDGVSLLLIVLTTFLTPLALWSSINSVQKKVKEFIICLLILEVGMIGVFAALDLFLFYVFWEVMLVPMYLIIGVWGGARRIYASVKFFIYTMAGSVLMLVGILYLYFKAGQSFNLIELYEYRLPLLAQVWVFLSFALAFGIKVPLFPFHTWLPDAHVEAPTAGSVILAGVLLKMGTYGFFRFAMPLFPEALILAKPYLIALAVIGIIYGALVAMVQTDIKKLIAYSSVSHLGVVMLGIFSLNPTGVSGGLYQMLNHGISTGALFLGVGMLYERTHSRAIIDHGGLAKRAPLFAVFFIIATLSSIGLPSTNGFIGEFLSLLGAFQTNKLAAILGTTGVILSAVYMLWMVERVFFGKFKIPASTKFPDLNLRESLIFIPLVILIFWMGIFPKCFLDKIDRPIEQVLVLMKGSQANSDLKGINK